MSNKPIGRPRTHDVKQITSNLQEYINTHDDPTIQGFCIEQDLSKDYLYQLADREEEDSINLSRTIKKAIAKQEQYLISLATPGRINPAFAMFRLKQPCHGWTDKQELQVDAKVVTFEGNDKLPK